MCTALTLRSPSGEIYFGRTMDFSYPLAPELYLVPKGYEWTNLLNTHKIHNRYRFMGIGQNIDPIIFADGVNEMGFSAAALYFPGYASYDSVLSRDGREPPIAAIELVGFLLGLSESVEHAVSILRTVRIAGVTDSITGSISPLHWIIADKRGRCMAVEKTSDGLRLLDNPAGVLSNSPDFLWHMTNLRNYMNVSPYQQKEKTWLPLTLTPFGQGAGTIGLPGDYTPPARFVRTVYHKSHTPIPEDRAEAVTTCFHILDSVSIPKGAVMTERGTPDYTQYTAFMNLASGEYFFKTYYNSRITAVKPPKLQEAGTEILSLGKLERPVIFDGLRSG